MPFSCSPPPPPSKTLLTVFTFTVTPDLLPVRAQPNIVRSRPSSLQLGYHHSSHISGSSISDPTVALNEETTGELEDPGGLNDLIVINISQHDPSQ